MSNESRVFASVPPKTLLEVVKQSEALNSLRQKPDPSSRDYIHISEHPSSVKEQFNTIEQETRRVEIVGVHLIWSETENDYGLMTYQGASVLDIKELTMYADTVTIASPLRFPGTKVTIYSRELKFEQEGCIDTSPCEWSTPAYEAERNGIYPKDYQCANGQNGEHAGDIWLYVNSINFPNDNKIRFQGNGAPGQQPEAGGLKPFVAGADSPSKNLDAVKPEGFEGHIANSGFPHVGSWRWPKGIESLSESALTQKSDSAGEVSNPSDIVHANYALKNGHIVYATLFAYDDNVVRKNIYRFYFPGEACLSYHSIDWVSDSDLAWILHPDFFDDDPNRKRPGNGEDAYAPGIPGNGGNAGSVYALANLEGLTQCSSLNPGQRGADPQGVKNGVQPGGEPGKPYPAYWATIEIVKTDVIESSRSPSIVLQDVSAKKGTDAPFDYSQCKPGENGSIQPIPIAPTSTAMWIHPAALNAVITYASDAFRNGWLDDAKAILAPYYNALQATTDSELTALQIAIGTMRSHLEQKRLVDYFGNPIGWVPRLNVTTNFDIFDKEYQNSAPLLYFTQRLLDKWEQLKDQQDFQNATARSLRDELESARKMFRDEGNRVGLITQLADAKDKLRQAADQLAQEQATFNDVKDQALREAKAQVEAEQEAQNLLKGFCKLIGGLAKIVPVGQPYLSLAGDTVVSISDFEWQDDQGNFSYDKVSESFSGFGSTLESNIDAFLGAHTDTLVKDTTSGLTHSIEELQKSIESTNTQSPWHQLRQNEIEALKKQIQDLEKISPSNEAEKEKRQKKFASLQDELRLVAQDRFETAKKRLQTQLDTATSELETHEKTRKQILVDQLEKLETNKQTLEEKTKETLGKLQGIGSGVSNIVQGISGLVFAKVTVEDDNPQVQKLMSTLDDINASSIFSDELKNKFNALKKSVEDCNQTKLEAMRDVISIQNQISYYTAAISKNLIASVALSQQRQFLDQSLSVGTKSHLNVIQQQIRERLQSALYDFVKAYQYEYLEDVGDDFYNFFGAYVGELCKLDNLDTDAALSSSSRVPTEQQFQETANTVLKEHYLSTAAKIVTDRQQFATSNNTNQVNCTLSRQQLDQLLNTGRVPLNLVQDFPTALNFELAKARITDVEMNEFQIEAQSNSDFSFGVRLYHSGVSVIKSPKSGKYYFFQQNKEDDPIAWGFVYRQHDQTIEKDQKADSSSPDEVLYAKLQNNPGMIPFKEYLPSCFSNLKLVLESNYDLKQYVRALTQVRFTVKYAFGQPRL